MARFFQFFILISNMFFSKNRKIPQTTFVLTFWPHIISELGGVPPLLFGTFNLKFVLERSPLAHFFQFFTLISNMVFSKTSIGPIGRADTPGPSPLTRSISILQNGVLAV